MLWARGVRGTKGMHGRVGYLSEDEEEASVLMVGAKKQ